MAGVQAAAGVLSLPHFVTFARLLSPKKSSKERRPRSTSYPGGPTIRLRRSKAERRCPAPAALRMKHLAVLLLTFSTGALGFAQEKPAATLKLEGKADMLALRATGTTDANTGTWQWRVLPRSAGDQVAWSHFDGPGADGTFKLATPMPPGGWHRLEVRVLDGDRVIRSASVICPAPKPLEMITPQRIATLPLGEQKA